MAVIALAAFIVIAHHAHAINHINQPIFKAVQ